MAKPIPVFSFVFASYAATSTAPELNAGRSWVKDLQPSDPFLTAWRSRSAHGGVLFAKIGLLRHSEKSELGLATLRLGEAAQELWLDNIVETPRGFIGAAMRGQDLPPRIEPGQRLRFHKINVLDWRLGEIERPCPTSHRDGDRRDPLDMLARLSETVGS